MNQENYITFSWNLPPDMDIDQEKSHIYYVGNVPQLALYTKRKPRSCPDCQSLMRVKGTRVKRITHVMRDSSPGIIEAHVREFICDTCGKTQVERLPIESDLRGRTQSVELEIIRCLADKSATFKSVSQRFGLSETCVRETFDKYVDFGREKLPRVLSVDEIYARRLTETKYCCVLYDPVGGKLVDLLDSRRFTELEEYLTHIPLEERKSVKYYVTDLNETYRRVHSRFFPDAMHAVDSFHVMKNLGDLLNQVRKRVMSAREEFKHVNDSSYWILKKCWKFLLIDPDRIGDRTFTFRKLDMELDATSMIAEMLKCDAGLREAYRLKEDYRDFNLSRFSHEKASEELEVLIGRFCTASTEEMRRFGSLLIGWRREIVNSFTWLDGWRLSNGRIERFNRDVKLLFENAYGFSNFVRARNRVFLVMNGEVVLKNDKRKFPCKREFPSRGSYKKHTTD